MELYKIESNRCLEHNNRFTVDNMYLILFNNTKFSELLRDTNNPYDKKLSIVELQ